MRLYEFANAQEQLALWKLISDTVWDSISVQTILGSLFCKISLLQNLHNFAFAATTP